MILLKNNEVILLKGIIYEKTYVLDTRVLIQSPVSLLCFEDNNLVLPIVCLEKLDKLKSKDEQCGSSARICIRFLEKLRQEGVGRISKKVFTCKKIVGKLEISGLKY